MLIVFIISFKYRSPNAFVFIEPNNRQSIVRRIVMKSYQQLIISKPKRSIVSYVMYINRICKSLLSY